jgi:hypothetical protein
MVIYMPVKGTVNIKNLFSSIFESKGKGTRHLTIAIIIVHYLHLLVGLEICQENSRSHVSGQEYKKKGIISQPY